MKQSPFFSTLRGRVILLVLIAILPALGLLTYYGLEGRAKARVEELDEALQLAREKLGLYEDTIRNVRQTLFTLSQIPQVRQHEPESCSGIFANLLGQTGAYTGLAAARPDGEVFASAPPITRPTSFADRPWFKRIMQTRDFVIGEYVLGRISGRSLIVLAYPVLDCTGEITAVLSVGLDLAWVSKTVSKSELAEGMTLTLIDSDGTILLCYPDPKKLVGKDMHQEPLIRTMLTRGEGAAEGVGLDGRPCLFGFTSMGKGVEAVHMGVSIPKALAFADVRRKTIQSLILLLLVAVTGLAGGWFISGLFVLTPVRRLLYMARQLAAGDLAIRSGPPYVKGEIGQLAYHFDMMAESLERREAERNRAEEALRESEERFRAIFEQAAVGVCQVETETGQFRIINQKYCDIVGYTQEEMAETTFMEITHPDDVQESLDNIQRLLRGEIRESTFEKRYIRKDGSVVWVNITTSAMWGLDEKPNYHIAVVEDITQRKLAEEALREITDNLKKAQEIAHIGNWSRDLDLNRGKWSDEMYRIFGLTPKGPGAPPFETFLTRVHPADRERVTSVFREAIEKKGSFDFEFRTVSIEGEEKTIRNRGEVVCDDTGSPFCIFGTAQDVTENRRLQAQLMQAQKMESIATLAGGIAHQFNNALTSITGYTGLLEMVYPEDERIMEYTRAMKQSALRMAHLTSQLLAYARGGRYNPQIISLAAFVRETLLLIQHTIDPDVHVETDLPLDTMNVEIDRTQMQMVLSAIVANSNEAIEGPGRIRICVRNMELDQEFIKDHPGLRPGPYVCLSIEDDGKGMDEETRNRIFEPFFTTRFIGRGLGKASVYGIIKAHDGWITVDSEPGKGTVVHIYLPAIDVKGLVEKEEDVKP